MENIIIFTKDGIKVRETITNPLMPKRQAESTVPYENITQYNPLDIHVIGIIPSVIDGVLNQIELRIGDDDSSPHDILWFKDRIQKCLKDGKDLKKENLYSKLEQEFSPADHKKLKGGQTRGYSNLTMALDLLKKENKLENPRKGIWRLRK